MSDAEPIRLSVIVPTHNVRPWIEETLFSLRRQDVAPMEIIVVDDHSDDGTPDVVEAAAAEDGRIRLVRAINRGGGSARNAGVELARGRLIVFCDGDDIVPDGAYRALVESLESSGSDIVFGDYWKFSSARSWRPTASMSAYGRPATAIRFVDQPTLLYSRPCWNKAFSREFWTREGLSFPDVPRSNDIVPMVQAYLAASTVDVIPDVVYLYRERPGGSSMSSRAGSDASILSYLAQELECARAIADAGDASLARVYAKLIYDRDGFAHVAKYLRGRDRDAPADGEVIALLRALMSSTGAIPHIEPLKRITFVLAAAGEFTGARSAAILAADDPDLAASTPAGAALLWTDLVDGLRRASAVSELDRPALRDDVRHVLASMDPADPVWFERWDALRRTVLAADSTLVSTSVPELMSRPQQELRDLLSRRDRCGARMERAGGGRRLVVAGTVRDRSACVGPALLVADDAGQPNLVMASRVRWTEDGTGGRWEGVFPARHVPLFGHVHAVMALADGSATAIASVAPEAAPRRWHSVFVARWGATTWAGRRRHWMLREAMAFLEPRAGRLAGRLRAQLGKKR